MPKISALPNQPTPTTSDKVPVVSGGQTNYELLSDLITLFFNNIPTGSPSPVTRFDEAFADFVASGGVWSGDSYGVNRNASMTAMVCYINGRRISIGAVTARTFTASVDTYIDVLDNLDGTGTLVYTTAVNNAASPALAANSIRIGVIVTGATTIAAVGSVNQGQETKILPIASSIAYATTDTLGNLICCRDATARTVGMRQTTSGQAVGTTAETLVTGLNTPIIADGVRKYLFTINAAPITGETSLLTIALYDGVFGSGGTKIQQFNVNGVSSNMSVLLIHKYTPTAGLHTMTATVQSTAGNPTINSNANAPSFLTAEKA